MGPAQGVAYLVRQGLAHQGDAPNRDDRHRAEQDLAIVVGPQAGDFRFDAGHGGIAARDISAPGRPDHVVVPAEAAQGQGVHRDDRPVDGRIRLISLDGPGTPDRIVGGDVAGHQELRGVSTPRQPVEVGLGLVLEELGRLVGIDVPVAVGGVARPHRELVDAVGVEAGQLAPGDQTEWIGPVGGMGLIAGRGGLSRGRRGGQDRAGQRGQHRRRCSSPVSDRNLQPAVGYPKRLPPSKVFLSKKCRYTTTFAQKNPGGGEKPRGWGGNPKGRGIGRRG